MPRTAPLALDGHRILVTGIADEGSLALPIARELARQGAELVCAGLGPTAHHGALSDAASRHLRESEGRFRETVGKQLGEQTPCLVFDAGLDASLEELATNVAADGRRLDGVLHAIAFDRTLRRGTARPLLEVTREEFLDCMSFSAYSLIGLTRALLGSGALARGSGIVALSYLGAERVMPHAYRNIGIAKAALERIVRELAAELAVPHGVRVNAVRFSPWAASRAGGAIPGLDAAQRSSHARAPLGNAAPESLASEVAHLLRPGLAVTGEVRHVDGGYHILG